MLFGTVGFTEFYSLQEQLPDNNSLIFRLTRWDTVNNRYEIEIRIDINFRQSFEIQVKNFDTSNSHYVSLTGIIYDLIT